VISLVGSNPVTVECGVAYVDAGATAADDCEGDLTASIVTVNPVNTNAVGSYAVTYNVTDAALNAATEVTRTVNVVDTTAPVIALVGSNPVTVECGDAYVDAGATAADDCEGNLTASIVIVSAVNANAVGSYAVTYNATDAALNAAVEVTRTVNVVDTTAPVISLVGSNPATAECGGAYVDAGATVVDGCDGVLTGSIVVVNPVNTAVKGSYTVTYDVSDAASNAAVQVTRTVNVVDTTAPVITRNGGSPVTVECGGIYTDAGATALDGCDGVLTSSIVTFNPVNVNVPASYTVRYNVSDSASNAAIQVTRTVNVVDNTAPIITMLGDASVQVECGAVYADAGATAVDGCDGNLTASIVTVNPVNTAVPGIYTVTYNVSDGVGNNAAQRSRTVEVVDTAAPVIALIGSNPETVECGDAYTDAGATATDVCEGNLTASIVTVNPVNEAVPGSYTVTYNVVDSASNAATEVTRTVNVVDTAAPVIALGGTTPVTVECGGTYTDAGATALDVCDGNLTASIVTVNPVNANVVGVYTVTYNVTDASSNVATEVTRTVNVADATAPVIALNGTSPVTVECGAAYADAGATANDACDGDLTASIVTVNPVNANVVGVYTVTYNVTDASSNVAAEVTRTVNVVDTTAPVITLLGSALVIVNLNDPYTDAGATAADACDGDLTASIVVTGDVVDTSAVGTFIVTYNVTDAAGLAAVEVTRTVEVVDVTQPYIVAVNVTSANTIEVVFNKGMGAGVNDPANYTVSGIGAGTLSPNPNSVAGAGTTWTLTWAGCPIMVKGGNVAITVNGAVQDDVGNVMTAPFTGTDVGGGIAGLPVITRLGTSPVTVECGGVYTDVGATALDQCGTNLTASIVTVNPVDAGAPGIYTVTYNVSDIAGNAAAEVTRTVNVVDTAAPVITRNGSGSLAIQCGSTYTDAGATASDICDGNLTASIITVNPVNTAIPGSYTVTYNVSDGVANAAAQVTRTVNVVDTTPPTITLLGSSPVTLQCGGTYSDAGATATDGCNGNLTASIVTVNNVNATAVGSYTVTYNVSDAAGNNAIEVVRTVNVTDTTAPAITRLGNATVTVECTDTYTDAGATAADACDGDVTASIVTANPVDTGVPGSYTVTYDVSDAASNAATQVTRTVNVVDTTTPVVSLNGTNPVTVECGDSYTDAGATATDTCDGDLTASIVVVNPVDTGVPGSYTITYNVSDSATNAAAQITRTVDVMDTGIPVITRLGIPMVSVECGSSYTDAGATALDVCDGVLTSSIVTVNPVNTSAEGSFTVTYDVVDGASNAAAQVTRTVNVIDTLAPVITLLGSPVVTLNLNDPYADAGATAADACDGNLTASIVTLNPVDTSASGTYVVTYNVTDASMNAAVQVIRTVEVVDASNPYVSSVTVMDEHTVRVVFSKPMGAGAMNVASYTLSGTGRGTLSLAPEGVSMVSGTTYDLTWSCPAIMRNGGNITITVDAALVDSDSNLIIPPLAQTHTNGATAQLPQITLNPDVTELTGECGVALAQPTRTFTDACGNGATPLTTWNYDGLVFSNPAAGVFNLVYRAQDAAGNLGTRNLTVYIYDTIAPVITLLGDNPYVVMLNDTYTDPGATATDSCEGDVSAMIVVDVAAVNMAIAGDYLVTYNVSDGEGNAATEVTRTVTVVDPGVPLAVAPLADIVIAEGASYDWSVVASGGTGVYTYQWFIWNAGASAFEALTDGSTGAGAYDGVTTATLSFNPFTETMAGLYKVEVSDSSETVEAQANVALEPPFVPVVGLFGMIALASATALGGALVLRRRR
jgi:large repetitive protein